MLRKIIHIDREKCNGCGACAQACHEGAIAMAEGKAALIRDDYCDGLGDCLPTCPTGAITFVEREAAAYDEAAVAAHRIKKASQGLTPDPSGSGCPGVRTSQLASGQGGDQLGNWPVQLKLAPVKAPWLDGASVLLAADCTAYTYARFHQDFIQGRAVLIACPKLDGVDYSEKLAALFQNNLIQNVLLVRMEVPCCGGLEMAAKKAIQASGKDLPLQVLTLSTDGRVLG